LQIDARQSGAHDARINTLTPEALAKGTDIRDILSLKTLPGLDALRALAILMVLFHHFDAPPFHGEVGPMGVELFFTLSGFLITGLLSNEHQKYGEISLSDFYRRRAFRIFPTFYVYWILTIVLMLIHHVPVVWWQAVTSFFYLTDYARAFGGNEVNMGISWSLGVEEQFYLLWPAVLVWTLNRRRSAAKIAGGIVLFVWVYRAVLFLGFGASMDYIYNAFDTRLDALMCGSLLAVIVRRDELPVGIRAAIRSPWFLALPSAALVGLLAFAPIVDATRPGWIFSLTIQPVLISCLLIQLVYFGGGWPILQHPVIRYIARISYALYLYHDFALSQAGWMPIQHSRKLIALVASFGLAMLSLHLIERPMMRIRDQRRILA
jgi:peptidoglycan/LPS O-acetylase OafA/YrhL